MKEVVARDQSFSSSPSAEVVPTGAPPTERVTRLSVRSLAVWLGVLMALLLFGALAEDVIERENTRFDAPVLLWLHAHSSPFFDGVMLGLSFVGGLNLVLLGLVLAASLGLRGFRAAASFLAVSLLGAGTINVVAKAAFHRARPDLWVSLAPEKDYGFPSGHAMVSSAFTMAVLVLVWRSDWSSKRKTVATVVGALFVAAVGLSRLYLGVHYPSDVMAGWCASTVWVLLLQRNFGDLASRNLLWWRAAR